MPLFGAHMSISGGLALAFDRLATVEGEALQIFTANQRQWQPKLADEQEVRLFRERRAAAGDIPVASHDSYLINLASPKTETAEKSRAALTKELRRCAALGVEYVVMHPGSHLGQGIAAGISRFTANLDRSLEASEVGNEVMVLLETTAGQGTSLGASFNELAEIIAGSAFSDQLGVCFDTCHVFAAGYDIRSPDQYEATIDEFDRVIGLEHLKCFHFNDSKFGLGEQKDRHAHIGQGHIGSEGFANFVNDPRWAGFAAHLETPKTEKDEHGSEIEMDPVNLAALRALAR